MEVCPQRLLGYKLDCDDEGFMDALKEGDAYTRYSNIIQAASNAVGSLIADKMIPVLIQVRSGRVRALAATQWQPYS